MGGGRGQASIEYAGLLMLMTTVSAALVATVPALDVRIPTLVLETLCSSVGASCGPVDDDLALEPCPVRRAATEEAFSATVLSVRAGRADTAVLDERSDGTATVTFRDAGDLGAEGGIGASFSAGRGSAGAGARAEGAAALRFASGSGYAFPSVTEARAFLERHALDQGLLAQVARAGVPGCALCGRPGLARAALPDPDLTFREGGPSARTTAEVAAGPAGADAEASGGALLGRRIDRQSGEITSYFGLTGAAATGASGGPLGMSAEARGERVIEFTRAADGTPLELAVRSSGGSRAGLDGELVPDGLGRLGARDAQAALDAHAAGGGVVEQLASLDLHRPRDAALAAALVEELQSPVDAAGLTASARAVYDRIAAAGQSDLRSFARTETELGVEGGAAIGLKIGAGLRRSTSDEELVGAYSRPPGADTYLERTDCVSP